jgi:hypothetical protein
VSANTKAEQLLFMLIIMCISGWNHPSNLSSDILGFGVPVSALAAVWTFGRCLDLWPLFGLHPAFEPAMRINTEIKKGNLRIIVTTLALLPDN